MKKIILILTLTLLATTDLMAVSHICSNADTYTCYQDYYGYEPVNPRGNYDYLCYKYEERWENMLFGCEINTYLCYGKRYNTYNGCEDCPIGSCQDPYCRVEEVSDADGCHWCEQGYYMSPEYKCETCPENGTSDLTINFDITNCHQQAGTHEDETGTYELSQDCYYQNSVQ
ncbi:MAG: hypothetical protein LBJ73_01485 [Rickettsiales bacterium]|jgi:hypothetical protein|nr:hypothetical protein [Rickettsiales bacterium]